MVSYCAFLDLVDICILASIESLKYYYLEIMPASTASAAFFDTCYSIHTQLTQQKHENVSCLIL